ncbi:MAG TPA: hypothetical protein VLF87_00760 [Patescibacteria group bacterium]|nr:hypothetical protein [Candidatus Saccharimonadales bacterium]HSX46508.1 hypothetical protein [Patescibacteria group bacterium]
MSTSNRIKQKVSTNIWVWVRFQNGALRKLKVMHNPEFETGVVSSQSPVGIALLGATINEERRYLLKGKINKLIVIDFDN